jgi:4-amino-4-deoxy-L-arabinose transferase-like glycosyltransferase
MVRKIEPIAPILIFLLALLLRVVYVLQLRSSPLFDTLVMDELYHDQWARTLASGNWLGSEAFFRAPLYPYLLGILYKLFGPNYLLIRLMQAFVGSISCTLVYLVAKRMFGFPIALISGIAASFYPMLMYYDGELLLDGLTVFLDLLLLFSLFKAKDTKSSTRFLLSGLILGLSAITRPNVLIFLPLILVWIFFVGFPKDAVRKKLIYSACLIGVCCLVIAPVTIRNYAVGRDFVPISSQAGINFYIGNNAHSDGLTAIAPGMRGTWWGGYEDAIRLADRAEGRRLKASEVSDHWMREGIKFMKEAPGAYLLLLGRKVWYFFSGREFSNNKDIYFFTRYSALTRFLLFKKLVYFPFGIVSPLSIVGLFLCLRQWRKLFLVYAFIGSYALSIVLFFVTSRYRIPVVPFLLIFAVIGAWKIVQLFERKAFKFAWLSAGALAVLLFLSNADILGPPPASPAQAYYTLGIAYGRKGKLDEAAKYYMMAIESDGTLADPHNNLGNLLAREGNLKKAREEYQKAMELDSSFAKTYYNMGNTYFAESEFKTAARFYEEAVRKDSFYVDAANSAGLAYQRLGESEEAQRMFTYAAKIRLDNVGTIEKLTETN